MNFSDEFGLCKGDTQSKKLAGQMIVANGGVTYGMPSQFQAQNDVTTNNIQATKQENNSSIPALVTQGLIGVGEMAAGVTIFVGITTGIALVETGTAVATTGTGNIPVTLGLGMSAVSGYALGAGIFADGVASLTYAVNGQIYNSLAITVLNTIASEPYNDIGNGLQKYKENIQK